MPKKKSTKTNPKSAPKKNKKKESKVEVKKIQGRKLIDEKIISVGGSHFPLTLAVVTVALLIAAVAFFTYAFFFRYSYDPPASQLSSIDVPVVNQEETESEESAGQQEDPVELPQEPEEELQMVRILETGVGYLNVRSGPGTGFERIDRVSPGQTFEMISRDDQTGWYEIRLDDERSGWVTGVYVETVDN